MAPAPPTEAAWDQSAQQQHWPEPAPLHHAPPTAQQARHSAPQRAPAAPPPEPPAYDPAAYGQPGADPYQAAPQPPPHLRGASYDQVPSYPHEQHGWPQPPADKSYAQDPGWPQQAYDAPYQPAAQNYDPHGGYQPQGYDQAAGYAQPGYDPQGYAYGDAGAPYPEFGNAGGQPQDYAADPGFGPADGGYAPPTAVQQGYDDQDYDPEELAYEDDAPSGRSRLIKMAAALVLAIGVGGGLAYGYKMLMGPSASGTPPVVRTATAPSKIKPEEPGGKKFAHTNSKILGRLSDAGDKPREETGADNSDSTSDSASGGTRKVSTMVIGRDGTIVSSPDTERAPPARLPQAVSPVPGMTIVDGFGGRQPSVSPQPPPSAPAMVNGTSPAARASTPPPPAAAPEAPARPAARSVEKPVIIARTEPRSEPPQPAATTPRPAPSKPAARARPAPAASSSAPGAGYVAVLASIPRSSSSRMSALARFADLQQKYAAQLGGKTPDVQEANLGAKGTYHRLIVGPPGSRQEASRLCSQLKSAGYAGCWIKSY